MSEHRIAMVGTPCEIMAAWSGIFFSEEQEAAIAASNWKDSTRR